MKLLLVALAALLAPAALVSRAGAESTPPRGEPRSDTATIVRVADTWLELERADGSTLRVATDTRTTVHRGAQQIPLAQLEPGDRVAISAGAERDRGGRPIVGRLQVVEDRSRAGAAPGAVGFGPTAASETEPDTPGATTPAATGASPITIPVRGDQGEDHGELRLRDTHAGLLLDADLRGLPPGAHAFHVHAVGRCEPPFESAGDHYTAADRKHGFLAAGGPHTGDLVNLHVSDDGRVQQELLAPELRLADLLDDDGAAFIVHERADDYASQPSGHAGGRIACAALQREAAPAAAVR